MKVRTDLLTTEHVELRHTVAVIDSAAKNRTDLSSPLRTTATVAVYAGIEVFDEAVEPGEAAIMVIGPALARPDHLDSVGRLLRSRPEIRAILVVDRLAADVLQQAIRAGVTDVVTKSANPSELIDAVIRADQALSAGRMGTLSTEDEDLGGRVGLVTTVFSPKGGSGKSMVATNLAVALAKHAAGPVVLLDADLQFGDAAVMLHMHPRHTIADAVASIDRLDLHLLRSMLAVHEPSGVLLLAAPLEPAMADRVTAVDIGVILNLLRSFAAHVVVDTPSAFNDVVITLLDRSDEIVVVGGMDIPTIKNVKVGLQTLGMLEIPSDRIHLVLNRANTKVKVEVQEVERTLQMRADALIPSDILVPTCVNRGVAAVLDVPRSGVARAINQLADALRADARKEGR
ncbi:MAG TPA: P-loop NTPase [Acidimicrobiales bacterium]|nr:P-loop NTPase [Acidimicrobiales bacterium]